MRLRTESKGYLRHTRERAVQVVPSSRRRKRPPRPARPRWIADGVVVLGRRPIPAQDGVVAERPGAQQQVEGRLSAGRDGRASGTRSTPGVSPACVSSNEWLAMSTAVTVMRVSVSVPGLVGADHRDRASVSTAGSLRIRARRLSMRWAPRDSAIVTTAVRASGRRPPPSSRR